MIIHQSHSIPAAIPDRSSRFLIIGLFHRNSHLKNSGDKEPSPSLASIVTLVFGFLYFALLIFAYSTMSYFSLGLGYFFLSDTAKIIIHLIARTPAIFLMVGGILGIWMKKRPDKIIIPLVIFIITAVLSLAYAFIGMPIGISIISLVLLVIDIVFGFQVRKAYQAYKAYQAASYRY